MAPVAGSLTTTVPSGAMLLMNGSPLVTGATAADSVLAPGAALGSAEQLHAHVGAKATVPVLSLLTRDPSVKSGAGAAASPSFRTPDIAVSVGGGRFAVGASTVVLLLEAAVRGGGLVGISVIALAAFRLPYAIVLLPGMAVVLETMICLTCADRPTDGNCVLMVYPR